jgi:flagellar protein FlaJ
MTLETAVSMAAKSNYGKLSPEIILMTNKLSWGTPFLRVMDIFEARVKESASIREVLNILREAYKSGGNVVATLDSAARNMNMLREAEEERRNITSQHVMITYGIFFLFLGIVVMIIYILVPMMSQQGGFTGQESESGMGLTTFTNPCADLILPFPCGLFRSTCSMLDVDPEGISCYYVSLFFFVLLIQGISSGLIAGQLGENSVIAGTKHAIIMVSISIFVFVFLAKMGVFPA